MATADGLQATFATADGVPIDEATPLTDEARIATIGTPMSACEQRRFTIGQAIFIELLDGIRAGVHVVLAHGSGV